MRHLSIDYNSPMKLFSWNVNGIRAVLNKGALQKFIEEHDPDILCLQETKASRDQVEINLPQYHEHFFSAVKKGYSGTAIFSKEPALRYVDGFPKEIIEEFNVTGDTYGNPNDEGRIIAAEFADFWVVTVYTPNSKGDLSRLSLRYDSWDRAFLAYVKKLGETKPVLLRRFECRSPRNRSGQSKTKCWQTRVHQRRARAIPGFPRCWFC